MASAFVCEVQIEKSAFEPAAFWRKSPRKNKTRGDDLEKPVTAGSQIQPRRILIRAGLHQDAVKTLSVRRGSIGRCHGGIGGLQLAVQVVPAAGQ